MCYYIIPYDCVSLNMIFITFVSFKILKEISYPFYTFCVKYSFLGSLYITKEAN